jgi:SAM-dependent methyltransferase
VTRDDAGVYVAAQGAGRELRVEGTSASWYQPGRLVTGSVWDALAVGLLWLPEARRRDALVLGLGGGSAARIVRAIAPAMRIVGVELDPRVIAVSRSDMDLDDLDVEVVEAEALAFLEEHEPRYDLVVEDVFAGGEDGLGKPPGFPDPALHRAAERLRPGGVLVADAIREPMEARRLLSARFERVVEIELGECTNRVFVACDDATLSAKQLRRRVAADPVLSGALYNLKFRTVAREA